MTLFRSAMRGARAWRRRSPHCAVELSLERRFRRRRRSPWCGENALRKALNAPQVRAGQQGDDAARARHESRAQAAGCSTKPSRLSSATSAAGRCRGARSTAFSGSLHRSTQASAIPRPSIPVPFAEGRYGSLASIRSEPKTGHEALVRRLWQLVRGRRRVRSAGPRTCRHRRRRERPSGVAALQRRGAALRVRRLAQGLFLSGAAQGPHRANVPPGRAS